MPRAVDLITVALTVAVIALLPIFLGGLGGWEAAVIFMFQQVGVSSSAAVLIAILGRAAGVVVALHMIQHALPAKPAASKINASIFLR